MRERAERAGGDLLGELVLGGADALLGGEAVVAEEDPHRVLHEPRDDERDCLRNFD